MPQSGAVHSIKSGKTPTQHMFSALPLRADIAQRSRHVRFVPLSDIQPVQGPSVTRSNRNEIDGANEEIEWHGQALETFTQ